MSESNRLTDLDTNSDIVQRKCLFFLLKPTHTHTRAHARNSRKRNEKLSQLLLTAKTKYTSRFQASPFIDVKSSTRRKLERRKNQKKNEDKRRKVYWSKEFC